MKYISTRSRAASRRRAASPTSCSKASRPTAACTCPRITRRSTRPPWRSGAACRTRELAFEILSLIHRRHPAPHDLRAIVRKTYTREVFGTDAIVPLKTLQPGLHLQALSNGPTLAFKDMAMQLLGNLFEYELAPPRRDAQHPGRHVGRHRQRRRVRHARQAGRQRLHAVAASAA